MIRKLVKILAIVDLILVLGLISTLIFGNPDWVEAFKVSWLYVIWVALTIVLSFVLVILVAFGPAIDYVNGDY